MIQIRINSKQYHGNYYIATICHTKNEVLSLNKEILLVSDVTVDTLPGNYIQSIEGVFVPILKVVKTGLHTFIYFPKYRHNIRKKVFSYNINLVQDERYRLTYNEKLFAGYIAGGEVVFEAAMKVWRGQKRGYYFVLIKRLFNNYDFIDFLFKEMSLTLRQELENRGINKGTIADKIAEFIGGKVIDKKTGELTEKTVPWNLQMWGLNAAKDILDRATAQPMSQGGFDQQSVLNTLKQQTTLSANHTSLQVLSDGNQHVVLPPEQNPF